MSATTLNSFPPFLSADNQLYKYSADGSFSIVANVILPNSVSTNTLNANTINASILAVANLSVNNATVGAVNASANGFTSLPNGLTMQWGRFAVNTTLQTLPWSQAFTSNAFSVGFTPNTPGVSISVISINSTAATVNSSANCLAYWHVIGQ